MSRNPYSRRDGERAADHVARLLADPLLEGATDAEIARFVPEGPAFVASCRPDHEVRALVGEELIERARRTAKAIGWDRWSGSLADLLAEALLCLELAACDEGRCLHSTCRRKRGASTLRRAA